MRAAHVHLDAPPPVLDDRFALDLLPGYLRRYIRRSAAFFPRWLSGFRIRDPAAAAMRSQIVVRSRYAEDALAEARARGATRYVVLGAGLDTFALRQEAPPIDVLEIDHPATQRWKQRVLQQRGITRPRALTFLGVNFEQQVLDDCWIDNDGADFISWLGTTYYLSRPAIGATLATLAERTRPGSRLVLDYWLERAPDVFGPLLLGTRIAVALQGEPMRSFFTPGEIGRLAVDAGWRVVTNCTPAEQNRRYLARRSDGLRVPSFAHLLLLER